MKRLSPVESQTKPLVLPKVLLVPQRLQQQLVILLLLLRIETERRPQAHE